MGTIGYFCASERTTNMIFDLQKASMWKRISASLFDFILLVIAVAGFAFLLSAILDYVNAGSDTSGDNESDLDVGPILPATHTLRPSEAASSAAERAILAPSYAI